MTKFEKDTNDYVRKERVRRLPSLDDTIIYCKFRGEYCNPDCPCYEQSDAYQRAFCEITQALVLLPKCLRKEMKKERGLRKRLTGVVTQPNKKHTGDMLNNRY